MQPYVYWYLLRCHKSPLHAFTQCINIESVWIPGRKLPYSQNFKILCSVFWGLKITEHTNTSHCCVRYFRADHFLKNAFFRTSIFSENRYNLPYVRYFFFHFLNFSKKYRTYGTISFSESEKKLPNLIKICLISGGLGQVDPNFLELPREGI